MGLYSNGYRGQQEQPGKVSEADSDRSKVNNPPGGERAPTAGCDGAGLNNPIEAVREVASKTPRRWP